MALPRPRDRVRTTRKSQSAGDAAEEGAGRSVQDLRQVLVHVAGGPRRPPPAGRPGAHDVAPGGELGRGPPGLGEETGRQVQDLDRGAQGVEAGGRGARIDQSER